MELEDNTTSAATSPGVLEALKIVDTGIKLIAERQKLIKIVDRSEHGWGVVYKYTTKDWRK